MLQVIFNLLRPFEGGRLRDGDRVPLVHGVVLGVHLHRGGHQLEGL